MNWVRWLECYFHGAHWFNTVDEGGRKVRKCVRCGLLEGYEAR